MLSEQQIEAYRRDGHLVIPRLIEGAQLAELRALTDRLIAEARGVSANDDLYDLEPNHSATLPRVRPAPIRIPLPAADHQGSIYENQRESGRRFFAIYEERPAAAD